MVENAANDGGNQKLRKAHSLSGVVPLGVFLTLHLWTNASILSGRAAFDQAVDRTERLPALSVLEVVFIFLPLAFHALYGVKLALDAKPDAKAYPNGKNWPYAWQRITAIVALIFVCAHLWEFRVQKWLYGMSSHSFFDTATLHMSSTSGGIPFVALGYSFALLCVIFHFSNGLVSFSKTWGVRASRQKTIAVLAWALGAVLLVLGFSTVVFLATGTRLLPMHQTTLEAPCPAQQ